MADSACARAFEVGGAYPTPLFVFNSQRLAEALARFRTFTGLLPIASEVFYSYKTNYLPALCEWLQAADVGAEITSPVEWDLATRLNRPEQVVVNGLGKCADGLLARIVADPGSRPRLINLETDTEVDLVLQRAHHALPLLVGLRVAAQRSTVERGNDPSERWDRGMDKFGWSLNGDTIVEVARRLAMESPAVRLVALHLHFGSQLVSAERYDSILRKVRGLLERLITAGVSITTLDLGGGIASGWVGKRRTGPLFDFLKAVGLRPPTKTQMAPDIDGMAAVIRAHSDALDRLGVKTLLFEPGRYLAEPSMLAVGQVISLRRDGERRHVVLNMGTNVLKCWRANETRPLMFDGDDTGSTESIELVGPLCHSSDTFGTVNAPKGLATGDLVCFDAVGAYTLGDWVANAWRRPAVYDEDGTLLWQGQVPVEPMLPTATHRGAGHGH
jgi:diaminopimelate decarboxylase